MTYPRLIVTGIGVLVYVRDEKEHKSLLALASVVCCVRDYFQYRANRFFGVFCKMKYVIFFPPLGVVGLIGLLSKQNRICFQ